MILWGVAFGKVNVSERYFATVIEADKGYAYVVCDPDDGGA